MSKPFDGDFSLLPIRAGIDHGPVPTHPTTDQFKLAGMAASNADPFTWAGAAAVWHMEAVRERRQRPGVALDEATLADIAQRTAARLYRAQQAA